MTQSKSSSFIEAVFNTVIGYAINLGVQIVVYPWFGATFTLEQNLYIGLIFMAVSLARSYCIRRYFNNHLHKMALRLSGDF